MVNDSYEKYLSAPFSYGGRGPDVFDCYGLLKRLYKEERGVEIPDFVSEDEVEKIAVLFHKGINEWEEVEEGKGVAVLFRIKGYGAHVGYCIGDGRFVHTWEKSCGVCIERLHLWRSRIIGYYDYVGIRE
jgi:cell wall-associated NlpC family hydrolase